MPRSGAEARHRLQEAALALYRERGYDATTTAEIAARAGVTERTFFRHFADKREVLFDGEAALRALLVQAVNEVPDTLPPLAAVLRALRAAVPLLENNRAFSVPRAQIIAATPALREREVAKAVSLSEAMAAALTARGVPDRQATLAAQIGMTAFGEAARLWTGDPDGDLNAYLTQAVDDLHQLGMNTV